MTDYIRELTRIFQASPSKIVAHEKSESVLLDMVADPYVIATALRRRIASGLSSGHYPVITLPFAANPELVIELNCWLPLPDAATGISTKSIHHHGTMLLTTASMFGPGYEHWTFELPVPIDPERELFSTRSIEKSSHPVGHLAFVDSYIAHVPLYPESLSVTLALWSSRDRTSWIDHLKRMSIFERHASRLRKIGTHLGLERALQLKNVEYFDFYPAEEGLIGMRERIEFPLGPTADYLTSLFHVVQETGNEALMPEIETAAQRMPQTVFSDRQLTQALIEQLHVGDPIPSRLSTGHFDVPHANFTREDIVRAVEQPLPGE